MKFLHTADIHLGKRFNDTSLIEDQKYILNQILEIAEEEHVDGIIIAGDIYQRSTPSEEAMELFNDFVCNATDRELKIYAISGNHDSDVRVSYMAPLMKKSGVYISEKFDGHLQSIDIDGAEGNITIHLMPFLKPVDVRPFYPEVEIKTYEDAIRTVLENSPLDKSKTNILVAHQFITGCSTSESEEFAIGGLDNISAGLFDDFDYVALGHLHGPQKAGRDMVRYSGSPLKYSFGEENHKKSVTILDVSSKSQLSEKQVLLRPLRDVRKISGTLSELLAMDPSDDYVWVTVTDELVNPDAKRNLQISFTNMLKYSVDNSKTQFSEEVTPLENVEDMPMDELFKRFYTYMNSTEPSEEIMKVLVDVVAEMEGEYETK